MGKKASKTTPRTTAVNPQAVAHSLTAFSPLPADEPATGSQPQPLYYAHLHAAPDAHTLRVYTVDGKCVSRWASNAHGDGASAGAGATSSADAEPRVRSLAWCSIPAQGSDEAAAAQQQAEGKRGKKRRKSDGGGAVDSPAKPAAADSTRPQAAAGQVVLALGLESGSILLWQPTGTQARTLSHPASTSAVTALAAPANAVAATGHLWSAHQDGSVRVWDLESGNVLGKVAGLAEEPRWDDLLVRYEPPVEGGKRTVQLVLSHLSLHVYTLQLGAASKKEGKVRDLKATELGRCTGHVEPCSIRWTGASDASSPSALETSPDKLSFLSYAPTDRFVQVWQIPAIPSSSPHVGLLLARLALDSGVASASVSPVASASQTLSAIDAATGNVSLTTLPLSFSAESASPAKKGKKHGLGVVALETQCEITAPAQGGRNEANVAEVTFRPGEEGKAVLCRGGVKPVFEVVAYKEERSYLAKVELARSAGGLLTANGASGSSAGAPEPARYSEQSTSAVAATAVTAAADSDDEEVVGGNAGELDVDMAEPTLADRLKAMNVSQKKERKAAARKQRALDTGDVEAASESEDDDELDLEGLDGDDDDLDGAAVPATTLTTTLVQALHSQDGPLLESCLNHSNPVLVRSTVKRLPSGGLVLSLLEALVDRLGKQKKGREGLASVKRARALIAWLRETLIVHVGFLVTIPSLVDRLAALHASLTQRLALQPTLLALNGRLDLVMSQIDLRQDRARAASERQLAAAAKKPSTGRRYVEGESTDEEGAGDSDDEDDEDEDLSEGDVEDVVLGAGGSDDEDDSAEDEDASDVDSDVEDEEDGASGAPRHKRNGVESLLELEAEDDEDFDEDEEDDGEDVGSEEEGEGSGEGSGEDSEFEK